MIRMRKASAQGVTLVEVVIAVAMLATGSAWMLSAIPGIHGSINVIGDMGQAVSHGVSVIEEIKALPTATFESYIPPPVTDLGGNATIRVVVFDNSDNEVELPADFSAVAAGIPDPAEVQVFIQWTDNFGRPKATTVSTMKRFF